MQWDRAEIVDFSLSVYTDHIIGIVPLKIKDNIDALIQPFNWRVWAIIACLPPMYLSIIALSEYAFNRQVKWWTFINFTLRPIFVQSLPVFPQANIYNKLFSINWIMMMYVLGQAYLGKSLTRFDMITANI